MTRRAGTYLGRSSLNLEVQVLANDGSLAIGSSSFPSVHTVSKRQLCCWIAFDLPTEDGSSLLPLLPLGHFVRHNLRLQLSPNPPDNFDFLVLLVQLPGDDGGDTISIGRLGWPGQLIYTGISSSSFRIS